MIDAAAIGQKYLQFPAMSDKIGDNTLADAPTGGKRHDLQAVSGHPAVRPGPGRHAPAGARGEGRSDRRARRSGDGGLRHGARRQLLDRKSVV